MAFISNSSLKQVDPADLHQLRLGKILGSDRFYRVAPKDVSKALLSLKGAQKMQNGALMIPFEAMEKLPIKMLLNIRSGDICGVMWVAGIFFALILLSLGFTYVEYYLMELCGQRIMQDMRMALFDRMQSQTLRFFDRHPVGSLVTRVTNDIGNLNEMFKSVLITVFKDLFMILGILGVLLLSQLASGAFVLYPAARDFCADLRFQHHGPGGFQGTSQQRVQNQRLSAGARQRYAGDSAFCSGSVSDGAL